MTNGCTTSLTVLALLIPLVVGCAGGPTMEAYRPLELPPASKSRAGQVRAVFMGTSTILLDDGRTQILVDGFFTRPGLSSMVLGLMRPNGARAKAALDRAGASAIDAVLVTHTHHDHALDAPDVALMRPPVGGTTVLVGSESLRNIAQGRGFPDAQVRPNPSRDKPYDFGRFSVWSFETEHSPTPLSKAGIVRPLGRAAHVLAYRMGPSHAFVVDHGDLRILIYPSAAPPKTSLRKLEADVVFLGVGKLGDQSAAFIDRYWQDVVVSSGARLVIPVHWDDFTKPFIFSESLIPKPPLARPLAPLGWPWDKANKGLDGLIQRSRRCGVEVRFAPAFQAVDLFARKAAPADAFPKKATPC